MVRNQVQCTVGCVCESEQQVQSRAGSYTGKKTPYEKHKLCQNIAAGC